MPTEMDSGQSRGGQAMPGLFRLSESSLVDAAHEGILMIDVRQRIVALNPAGERLIGLPAKRALGEPLSRFLPARFRDLHADHVDRFAESQALQRRMAGHRSVQLLRADGTEVPVEVMLSRVDVATADGPRLYFAALVHDLSDTVALERSLEQERERLRLVFDLAPVAMWVVEDEAVVFVNREALRLLGLQSPAELQGRSVYDLLRADSHAALRRQVQRVRDGGAATEHVRAVLAHSDGQWREVELALAALPDHGRTMVQMVVADVTRREHDAQALERSRHALRQLSASLVRAREDERKRIARELHDELGQRLTALKMDLSTLAVRSTDPCAARVPPMLAMLDDTVASVRRIAADLRPMMLDDLGLYAAVQWLASDASRRLGLPVKVLLDEEEPALPEPTATALYRIVQEALTNAARHARASSVTVSLRRQGDEMQLCVEDNGIGLPPGALQREGSYGLLGIQERVQDLGGSLEVQDTGAGTRLTVHVPAPPPEPPPAGGAAGVPKPARSE